MSARLSSTPSSDSSRVEAVARELDDLHRLLDALQREVLRLGGDQRAVGGDERVDRSAAPARAGSRSGSRRSRRRASASARRSVSSRPILPPSISSASARLRLAGMMSSWIASARRGAAGEHVGDRRLDVGGQVEVVREVALRVEIDRQRAHAAAAQHVGQRAHRGRLAGAALLGEHRDRLGHGRDTTQPGAAGSAAAPCPALRSSARLSVLESERRSARGRWLRLGVRGHAQEGQPVAPDDDLVAVLEHPARRRARRSRTRR